MIKINKRITLVVGLIMAIQTSLIAQEFQGIATYQSGRKVKGLNFNGRSITPQLEAQIMEQMKKRFQKEYELAFNLTESTWKEVESLDSGLPTESMGGGIIMMSTRGGIIYKNIAEKLYLQETKVFSKPFLVNDKLESREWEITSETKKIGNYTVTKAIYTDVRESQTISFSSEGEDTPKVSMDTTKVEAWFTPQIPVSQGPGDYWGLPGLILEVNDGTTSYLCTKIILKPKKGISIKRPNKGKKVTREELKKENDAKAIEMMEEFRKDGNTKTIRVNSGR